VLLNPTRLTHKISSTCVLVPIKHTVEKFANPSPGANWRYWWWLWINLFGNIVLFLPYGFWAHECFSKKNNNLFFVLITGVLISIIIECCQKIFSLGVFDVDDIILNTIGVLIGAMLFIHSGKKELRQELKTDNHVF